MPSNASCSLGASRSSSPSSEGLDHAVAAVGYRDGDAEWPCGSAVLAQQHVQDDAVDAVVLAVQGDGADDVRALAEPVDPAFALLVAGRVPGQVVVDDGLEVFLQVDAFGQAVGRDQHVPAAARRSGRRSVASRSSGGSTPVTAATA